MKKADRQHAGADGADKSKTCFPDLSATDVKGGKGADQPFKNEMAVL